MSPSATEQALRHESGRPRQDVRRRPAAPPRRASTPELRAAAVEHQSRVAVAGSPSLRAAEAAVLVPRLDPMVPAVSVFAKRAFDVMGAVLALVLLLPVLAVVALLVTATSPGPVLFRQQRLGRGGRTFTCLKFRTMHVDAAARLEVLMREDDELRQEWESRQKLRDDPRITIIGAVLRRTSLDELPQLVNIILGDMSVVGPRPIVERERARYGAAMGTVLTVRPGLTGLWQVSGRNDTTYRQRVNLDVRYVETRTFGMDVAICLRTVRQLLSVGRNGAY